MSASPAIHLAESVPLTREGIFRSKKWRAASHGAPCWRCLWLFGRYSIAETVPAHYTGAFQHALGKGKAIKATDAAVADLCHECHEYFDRPEVRKDPAAGEEMLLYVVLSVNRRLVLIKSGHLKV